MKLLGSTKSKKTKDENGENAPHSKITEVILAHCLRYRIFFCSKYW